MQAEEEKNGGDKTRYSDDRNSLVSSSARQRPPRQSQIEMEVSKFVLNSVSTEGNQSRRGSTAMHRAALSSGDFRQSF